MNQSEQRKKTIIYVSSSSDQSKRLKYCGTYGQNHRARVKKFQVILKIIEMTHYHSNHLANISDTLKKRRGW